MPFGTIELNDGYKIPVIAFGTGTANRGRDATDYVAQALEVGFAHIDTAQIYRNEDSVGTAIRESGLSRSELYVTTKYATGSIYQTVRESLAKLGLKHIDLYLIHAPSSVEPDFEAAWKEFENIRDAGLAKSIGVSNFNVEQLQTVIKVAKIKPAVNQIRLEPYNYAEQKAVLDYCSKHAIVIEAYSSLAPLTTYPGGPVDAALNAAATLRGATPAQILFAWVRAKGAVIVTTSSKKQRLQEYLEAADIAPLTDEEIAAIDEAGAKGPPARAATIFISNVRSPFMTIILFIILVLVLIASFRGLGA